MIGLIPHSSWGLTRLDAYIFVYHLLIHPPTPIYSASQTPYTCLSITLTSLHPPTHLSIHLSIHQDTHLFIPTPHHLSIHPSIYTHIHAPHTHLPIYPFIHPPGHLFIHTYTQACIHSPIHPSIQGIIYPMCFMLRTQRVKFSRISSLREKAGIGIMTAP